MLHGLPRLPILSLGSFIDERGNVFRLSPKEPRRVPKGGPRTVTNGDGGGSIEKVEVLLITWVSHSHPHLGGLLPFVPRPSQTESPRKLVSVEYPKASVL